MAKTRVTDLDAFALEQIWRPYQSLMGYEQRLSKSPVDLDGTLNLLRQESEWSRCVLNRLAAIGFYFPDYVRHPLVDFLRQHGGE